MTDRPDRNSPADSGKPLASDSLSTWVNRASVRGGWGPGTMAALFLVAAALCLPTAVAAQTEEVLWSFTGGGDGFSPYAGLIQAVDGSFYGTAAYGGVSAGTVFKIDSAGNFMTLHGFVGSPDDGAVPRAALIQAADGNFYGTTYNGGTGSCGAGCGTVFKMDSTGNVTILHSFVNSPDGAFPRSGLMQASDGNFYGTTYNGGSGVCGSVGCGTVFKMGSSGNVTVLHSFAGSPSGANPSAALIQATDGNFYGTTSSGGAGGGTAFKMDSAGNLTTLHSFMGGDGAGPYGGLIQATDGNFYGTTGYGGASNYGTVFKMSGSGDVTTLFSFTGGGDGLGPIGGLIGDGNFYGTTGSGGGGTCPGGCGTVFKIDSSGNLMTLYTFSGYPSDAGNSQAGLTRATDGNYYGTTLYGGIGGVGGNVGAIFRLTCSPTPVPSVTVTRCLPANAPGLMASVTGNGGDTYLWTLSGGTIDSGQGTNSIGFTSGGPGALMSLEIVETNPLNCYGNASQNLQVDFADEPPSDAFYSYVCTLGRNRITSGCGGGNYCPGSPVTRAQMAVFLLKSEHGSSYNPPACAGIFNDVACPGGFAVNWIEQLVSEGVTAGCGGGNYCPDSPVTRAEMAVFLLTAEHGSGYTPPACTAPGTFGDVPCPGGFAVDWIEQLSQEGIAAGCQVSPPLYCPNSPNTRGQMAVFLVTTFNLQ